MIEKPGTFRDLIVRLGGVNAFAAKMKIGEFAAKKMRDRSSIAIDHWPDVIAIARKDGLILTTDDLVNMKLAGKPPVEPRKARAAA